MICFLIQKKKRHAFDFIKKNRIASKFKKLEKQMETLQAELKPMLNDKALSADERNVATVLNRLTVSLKTTAVKARNDLLK